MPVFIRFMSQVAYLPRGLPAGKLGELALMSDNNRVLRLGVVLYGDSMASSESSFFPEKWPFMTLSA